jgi:putative transposase
MKKQPGYSKEVRERAVRMVLTSEHDHASRWSAIQSIASKIGCTPETLRSWIKKMEVDVGSRPGVPSDHTERMKKLERENRELKRANEILRKAADFFRPSGVRSAAVAAPTEVMVDFIDQYRDRYGVEPIWKELPIAPSTYHHHKTLEQHPERRCERVKNDEQLTPEIQRVWLENHRNYGARKIWKQLNRESIPAARCTVERLGLEGVRRGRRCITNVY